ncbi:hypothetical protein) [Alteracholeplasma palmae J233]|uniref:DUF2188 domain-containing protein n=1 Tax=Alteracholeplasma palmae (strain ATCC 49389 / J233) TaxID=1318466 RepID=U4KNT7_ALTPJ|nr:DUF2188 domain-containing protein [Alteracholeplasma palmae]CCV63875.1 hypothetical protein) [Alteracholeplasma palmae J233]
MGFWIFGKKKKKVETPEVKKVEVEETKQEVKEEKVVNKPVEKKQPVVKELTQEESKQEADEEKTKKQPSNKYHVSQNKDDKSANFKKWRVRKAGSDKTIKFFDTQAEAIKFAEGLAESNDGSVIIHKVDGSIRKQDYTKK